MSELRIEYLFDCYVYGKCSLDEEIEFMAILAESKNEPMVQGLLEKIFENSGQEIQVPKEVAASILHNIFEREDEFVIPVKRKKVHFRIWMRVAAAAVVLLIITSYWFLDKKNYNIENAKVMNGSEKYAPILPGGNHAILTLADGKIFMLDSVQNGNVQHGILKIKKQSGLLIFERIAQNSIVEVSFNMLSTPRGGQYKIVLPDESEVWLNAYSSLRFPTVFSENVRVVELKGEAYFEVAEDRSKPFHVKVGDMQVNVLGTRFNINAYSDEYTIKTSLLEGSVKLYDGKLSYLLKAGQQGILSKEENTLKIKEVDMNEVVAWKNGLFQFDGADITDIMNQISRWYNVEIIYSARIPDRRFEGKISRNAQLSDVLKILELSDVKFTVEGNKIIVQ